METRDRILEAAKLVFARDGFVETTLAEIAREAGLGKSSLFRHVKSKAELFVEALLDQATDTRPYIETVFASTDEPEERLRRLADAQRGFLLANPGFRQVVWALDNQDLIGEVPKELAARARERWRPPLEALEQVIEAGIATGDFRPCDPKVTAHLIWNLGNLSFELRFSHERRRALGVSLERLMEEGIELILTGLRARCDSTDLPPHRVKVASET